MIKHELYSKPDQFDNDKITKDVTVFFWYSHCYCYIITNSMHIFLHNYISYNT